MMRSATTSFRLRNHFMNDAAKDVGQPRVAPLMKIRQLFVVHAHQRQERGVDVVQVDLVFHGGEAEFVGLAIRHAPFDAAAGQPHGKAVRIVVAARRPFPFGKRHPAEFASPQNQRAIQQSATFQVREQAGDGAVDLGRVAP